MKITINSVHDIGFFTNELFKNNLIVSAFFIIFLLLIFLLIIIFVSRNRFKKTNSLLSEKNKEIVSQREEIQKQKDHITKKTLDLLVLNKELKENAELREGLTGMIVHDLKNPISNIINLSENREISFFAKEMLTMVENILDIQKYEGMLMPLNLKSLSLKKLTDEAVVQVSLFAEHKNIKIENHIKNNIFITADEEIIRRVFVNFLSNAIKYTLSNGLVKITGKIDDSDSGKFKISVTDNGIGIKHETIPLIFNKFNQIVARKTGEARSTGIGLTFCKMAVEAHQSNIIVKSVPDVYTSFEFSLPYTNTENSEHQIIDKKIKKLILNDDDKTYLINFYEDLKNLEVYEISKLRVIINKIDETFSENIKFWKNEINNAIYNCNFELYNSLKEFIVE